MRLELSLCKSKHIIITVLFLTFSLCVSAQIIKTISIDDEKMKNLITLKEGDVFTPTKGVDTIKTLFRTGFFSNVEIEKKENKDGTLDIKINLARKILFSKPIIKGSHKIKKKKLAHFLSLYNITGTEYNDDKVSDFLNALKEYLEKLGYSDAELQYNCKLNKLLSEVTLTVTIHYGSPVVVKSIKTNSKIFKKISYLKNGKVYNQEQLKHDIEKLKKLLIEDNYYKYKINQDVKVIEKEAYITVNVDKGKKFKLVVEHFSLSNEEKAKIFRFFKQGNVDKFSLNYIRKNLEYLAMEKGYYKPEFEVVLVEDRLNCRFLNPKKLQIKKIKINSPENLNIGTYAFFNSLVKNTIIQNTMNYLRQKNYDNASVNVDYNKKTGVLNIDVLQGRLLKLGKISKSIPANLHLPLLNKLKKGDLYSKAIINEFAGELRSKLREMGFYNFSVTITPKQQINGEVPLEIDISVEPKRYLSEIYIYGLSDIQEQTVASFIKFKKGDVFRAEDVSKVKENLYYSSYFSEVKVEAFTTGKDKVVLFVKLREKNLVSISYGFGGNTDEGLRVFGKLKKSYLMNRNLTGTLFARHSDKKAQLYLSIAGRYGFLSTLYYIFDDKNDYDFAKVGVSTSYSFKYKGNKTLILGFDFKKSNLNNVNVVEEEIEKEHFPDYTGKFVARLLVDKRDNILYPSKGYFFDLKAEPTYDFDLKDNYFKFTGKSAFYLGNFAFSQTLGIISSVDGDVSNTPIPERFFTGGANTLRISSFEKAGPLFSNGAPKGGNFLALFSGEYRFLLNEELGIGATLFFDVGNVWRDVSDASYSTAIKDAGFGIWYKTPIGPIKLELAFNLDNDTFNTDRRLVFSIGHSF